LLLSLITKYAQYKILKSLNRTQSFNITPKSMRQYINIFIY